LIILSHIEKLLLGYLWAGAGFTSRGLGFNCQRMLHSAEAAAILTFDGQALVADGFVLQPQMLS